MHFVARFQPSLDSSTGISTLKMKPPSDGKDNGRKKVRAKTERDSGEEAERQ